jgi:hypothetical protein
MECGEDPELGGPGGRVTVELSWERVSLLPGGIARTERYGDMLVLGMHPALAQPYGWNELRDAASGEVVATPDVFPPSDAEATAAGMSGSAMIGIEPARLRAGHTYRISWPFTAFDRTEMSQLQATVTYWHVDAFSSHLLIDCHGTIERWTNAGS